MMSIKRLCVTGLFELFARIFVFVSRTNDCVEGLRLSWKWDWTRNLVHLYE